MSHFGDTTKLSRTTPSEWLGVGAKIGELVNDWAMRSDLVAYVGAEAAVDMGAPALFSPETAEIEVNTKIAFGHVLPEHVGDMTERSNQFEFPVASGAILHEAMHARYSTWDMRKAMVELSANEYKALHLLEESRIEALGVRAYPANRAFLRASAMEIVLADMSEDSVAKLTQVRQVAFLLGLTYARVSAGVLDNSDVEPVHEIVKTTLPQDKLDALRAIWLEFQRLDARTGEARMYDLAREWERVVKETSEEAGEPQGSEAGELGEAMAEFAEALKEALEEAAGEASIGAIMEAQDQQTSEEYKEEASKAGKSAEERRKHRETAEVVFGQGSTPDDSGSYSSLVETRNPTSEERVSAVRIGQALERAKYRDRVRIESGSVVPPGRLRTRALVQGEAQKERGIQTPTEAFRRVQRKHTEDPNLTIGVMVDISGSMRSAMNPMASAAWILSEATRRVQGKVAMTYYGSGVFSTLRAGQHLDKVNVYTASDATEKFDRAFQALDGSLNLLNGSGARLLVVVSDGAYTAEEARKAREWVKRCDREGVAVLWLGAGSYGSSGERYTRDVASAVHVELGASVTDAADEIGRMAERALTTAGSRR